MPGADFVLDKGLLAQTALSKFRVVKGGTADESCTAVTAAADLPLGVVQHAVAAGDAGKQIADVRMMGVTKLEAGAAISRWDRVKLHTSNDGKVATNAVGTLANVVGIALSAASAAGDIIDVLLTPGARDAAS
jgi:hypothetical protein